MAAAGTTAPMVIIGGGIAGVTCAQELCRLLQAKMDEEENSSKASGAPLSTSVPHVMLISQSAVVKVATNIVRVTKTIEQFGTNGNAYPACLILLTTCLS